MRKASWFRWLLATLFCFVAFGSASAQSSLPSAKEVVQRYDEALGGRDAIMPHTSSTTCGTMEAHDSTAVFKLSLAMSARPSSDWRKFRCLTAPATS
jgi:hypothetical protein